MDWILGGLALLATATARHYVLASPRSRQMTKRAEAAYFVFWAVVSALIVFTGGGLRWFGSEWLFLLVGLMTLSLARLYLLKRTAPLGSRRSAAIYAAFWPAVAGIALFASGYMDSVGSIAMGLGLVVLMYLGSYAWTEFLFRAFSGALDHPKRHGPRG